MLAHAVNRVQVPVPGGIARCDLHTCCRSCRAGTTSGWNREPFEQELGCVVVSFALAVRHGLFAAQYPVEPIGERSGNRQLRHRADGRQRSRRNWTADPALSRRLIRRSGDPAPLLAPHASKPSTCERMFVLDLRGCQGVRRNRPAPAVHWCIVMLSGRGPVSRLRSVHGGAEMSEPGSCRQSDLAGRLVWARAAPSAAVVVSA